MTAVQDDASERTPLVRDVGARKTMSAVQDDASERTPLVRDMEARKPDPGASAPPTPLPWRPVLTLLLLNSISPLAFEIIFPFINQMLVELRIVDDPRRVGFYSGVIESLFSCMSLLTIFPTTYASNHVGRKPVILFGMAGVGVSIICFGFSRTFFTLILSRCIGGALGGAWAAIKIMIGELTDRSNQNIAFSGLTITYRLGQIIGMPLGGFLAHPERHAPSWFRGEFWMAYPFILPCLVGGGFAILAVILGAIFVEETLPSKRPRRKRRSGTQTPNPTTQVALQNTQSDVPVIPTLSSEGDFAPHHIPSSQPARKKEEVPPLLSVLTWPLISLMLSNICMCLISELTFSVYPLYAFTPIALGGLGFTEAQIGAHLSVRAIVHITTMFAFAPIHRYIGRTSAVRIYQISMSLWPVVVLFYPLLNWVIAYNGGRTDGWAFYTLVGIFFFVWSIAGFGWTATAMLANDEAPSAAALASVNGLQQISIVIPQAIAPALSTSLFAFSIEHDILRGNLVWLVFFIIASVGFVHSLTLRESTTDWRSDAKNNEDAYDHDD